jgi:hypothetical protein
VEISNARGADFRRLPTSPIGVLRAAVVAGLVGGVMACGDQQTVDFSDFGVFTYEQGPGLGFCPVLQSTFRAEVTSGYTGVYSYATSILRSAQNGVDSCVATIDGCREEVRLPVRTLTGAELDRLLDAFAAVEVESEADPECEDVAIDPCRILRYSWDSFQATDFTCSAPRLRDSEAHRIRLLIEELTDASRPAQ